MDWSSARFCDKRFKSRVRVPLRALDENDEMLICLVCSLDHIQYGKLTSKARYRSVQYHIQRGHENWPRTEWWTFPVKFNQIPAYIYIADPETCICFSCLKASRSYLSSSIGLEMLVEDVYTDRMPTFCFKTFDSVSSCMVTDDHLRFVSLTFDLRCPQTGKGWFYRMDKGLPRSFYLFIVSAAAS